jgi:CheY-like chemotaxis protein
LARCRVLVVEDSEAQCQQLEDALCSRGCDVEHAHNQFEAEVFFLAGTFDVNVVDIELVDGISGIDLARRAISKYPDACGRLFFYTVFGMDDRVGREASLIGTVLTKDHGDIETVVSAVLSAFEERTRTS